MFPLYGTQKRDAMFRQLPIQYKWKILLGRCVDDKQYVIHWFDAYKRLNKVRFASTNLKEHFSLTWDEFDKPALLRRSNFGDGLFNKLPDYPFSSGTKLIFKYLLSLIWYYRKPFHKKFTFSHLIMTSKSCLKMENDV